MNRIKTLSTSRRFQRQRKIVLAGNSGLTLVEVIMVMAIIGILAGVAVPVILTWLPDIRLKGAARNLYSHMQQARMLAIKENRNSAMIFNTGGNGYTLQRDYGGANTVVLTVTLNDYGSGVKFGNGNATQGVDGAALPANDVSYPNVNPPNQPGVVFTPKGGTINNGYVYLDNQDNTTTYAVGTVTGGSIQMRRWISAAAATPWQ